MAHHSGWKGRQAAPARQTAGRQTASGGQSDRRVPRQSGTPAYTEPEVRRWPHPVTGAEVPSSSGRQAGECLAPGQMDAALYYIHCALSYQNQLLADITALLEQLVADTGAASEGKAHASDGSRPSPGAEK